MQNDLWNIMGLSLGSCEKKQLEIHPWGEGYTIPATFIKGGKKGKTILISAGLHSGEYPGVAACAKVAAALDPAKVWGQIIILHAINTSGFFAHTEAVVAEDGVNLNACFPGDKEGSIGQKIAAYLVAEVMPQVDFIMDLHSGGGMEPLAPCLFFPADAGEEVREISLGAAAAITTPHLIASKANCGFYSYGAKLGIPGILVERGCCNQCFPDDVEKVVEDVFLLLAHFDVISRHKKTTLPEKIIWEKVDYIVSQHQGLWYPVVEPGDIVKKGGLIGVVQDFFGTVIGEYRASADCRIMYNFTGLALKNGSPLAACGVIDKAYLLL